MEDRTCNNCERNLTYCECKRVSKSHDTKIINAYKERLKAEIEIKVKQVSFSSNVQDYINLPDEILKIIESTN